MKKIKAFFAFVLAVCTAFALVGCSETSQSDSTPPVWDTATFVRSGELAPTHEWRLYEEALAEGYEGSFVEFLQEIETTVSDDTAAINYALTSAVCVESTFGTGANAKGSLGSGVIYSLDKSAGNAYVITNYHVIYGENKTGRYSLASKIEIYLYGGYVSTRSISATVCGGDINKDIAVLWVTGSSVLKNSYATAAQIGDSTALKAGERVYALGNPNGEGFSVTGGVVSVPLETITDNLRADNQVITLPEIRIDVTINHGNSGGGLFNSKGELVGIVNARYEGEDAVGYAIPTATVIPIVKQLAG